MKIFLRNKLLLCNFLVMSRKLKKKKFIIHFMELLFFAKKCYTFSTLDDIFEVEGDIQYNLITKRYKNISGSFKNIVSLTEFATIINIWSRVYYIPFPMRSS